MTAKYSRKKCLCLANSKNQAFLIRKFAFIPLKSNLISKSQRSISDEPYLVRHDRFVGKKSKYTRMTVCG